ncbi:MAG TPA: FtsQ-type POTRA domain-containing protein, partial [Gemmatirosa sp.]
ARLAVDTTASVWMDVAVLTRRVASDPLVADARVERRLPGVLRVVVHERVPVAIVPGARGALVVYDATGVALPLSPARVGGVDVPLAASADPALLRALGALRAGAPRVYARVLEAARAPRAAAGAVGPAPLGGASSAPDRDELDFVLAAEPPAAAAPGSAAASSGSVFVRAAVDVNAARFSDLAPVERDLARRGVRAAELDLRFRDQVVARLP